MSPRSGYNWAPAESPHSRENILPARGCRPSLMWSPYLPGSLLCSPIFPKCPIYFLWPRSDPCVTQALVPTHLCQRVPLTSCLGRHCEPLGALHGICLRSLPKQGYPLPSSTLGVQWAQNACWTAVSEGGDKHLDQSHVHTSCVSLMTDSKLLGNTTHQPTGRSGQGWAPHP